MTAQQPQADVGDQESEQDRHAVRRPGGMHARSRERRGIGQKEDRDRRRHGEGQQRHDFQDRASAEADHGGDDQDRASDEIEQVQALLPQAGL